MTSGGKSYDVRVVSVPSQYGHALVLRIPNAAVAFGGLSKLGFRPDVRAQLEDLADTPSGLLLLAGPVGSGATTTAFSLLHKINSLEKKIWTLEPRIEYRLGGVEQIAVEGFRGLNVTSALAAVLRADPDIVLVADVRNPQTAQAAVDAAGAGCLTLATLNAPNAVSALARLAEFGIGREVIGRTVIGVCAQRLARRVCTECREAYAVPAGELQWLDLDRQEPATLFRGQGCPACRNTGYKGRVGLYELLRINEEIAELLVRNAPPSDLMEAARANGIMTLRQDGFFKALDGATTPGEVYRLLHRLGRGQ